MNLSIIDDITFRKLTIFMMLVEKGNIARTAEALHTLEENVRGPLFVHKGLFGTRPDIKVTVAVGSAAPEQKPALCDLAAKVAVIYFRQRVVHAK